MKRVTDKFRTPPLPVTSLKGRFIHEAFKGGGETTVIRGEVWDPLFERRLRLIRL